MPVLSTRGASSVRGFGFGGGPSYLICGTGGTITYDGNYRIHTFTGPGTLTITKISPSVPAPAQVADYLVIGSGGGGPGGRSGGGGAGGFRESKQTGAPWTASPLAVSTGIPISATSYPISVGAGGAYGVSGNPSTFSTITSNGGGLGGSFDGPPFSGAPGGSGGGGTGEGGGPASAGGSGNVPATTPPQGNSGGSGSNQNLGPFSGSGGGGGGAATSGSPAPGGLTGGNGGTGAATNINPAGGTAGPTPGIRYYSGGGGGGVQFTGSTPTLAPPGATAAIGVGGAGGGGGYYPGGTPLNDGASNTGGGGIGGAGGSGVVIIKYKVL